jgi:hypothetical protein
VSQYDTRGAAPPDQRWCALCGAQYPPGFADCTACLVPLVDAPPLTVDDIGDENGDQLAYDLDDVDATERLAIDRDLAERGIVHAWDGATLIVAPYDEPDVDAVLGGGAEQGELTDDEDQLLYDLSDWDPARRAELAARLEAEGFAHAFDEHGDLVVLAADEDAVDAILDEVEFPDQLEAEDVPGDGLDAVETLGALFVAADRLHHDPADPDGVLAAADAARELAVMAPPFGFDTRTWEAVIEQARALARLLESEASLVDDEEVVEAAQRLRTTLRPLV